MAILGQLTPEIQAEIDRFNGEMLDTRRRLRDVQFQLTEDIDQLGANLKAINTVLVPVLLTALRYSHTTPDEASSLGCEHSPRQISTLVTVCGAGQVHRDKGLFPSLLRIISSPPWACAISLQR